jgi:hypothetical protein
LRALVRAGEHALGERDRDDDRIWRAAFREGYRRNPRAGELSNYKYWHWVSRNHSFDTAGDWRDWPTKAIPPDAVVPEPKPAEPVQLRNPALLTRLRNDEHTQAAERLLRRR